MHRQRRYALDRGTGGDERHPDPLAPHLFGRRGGGVAQVGVVGQQHHLARVGAPYGLDELAARGWLTRACEYGGGAGLRVQPGQALARHHGDDGALDPLPRVRPAPGRARPRRRSG